jgi:DNA-binding MarR family transcriptional regulator
MTGEAQTSDQLLHTMAEEIFAITVLSWRDRLANRSNANELSESQFLTLDMLAKDKTQTVGELQRSIKVLPAQMSRIIRSLETGFDKPLIRCELNQSDKRKIDVSLTPAGRALYDDFRRGRLAKTVEILTSLPDEDRQHFVRICREIKDLYRKNEAATSPAE